ncbi:MAG TPA: response regulator [Verrucomicrobiae bacterium]
MKNEIRVLIVEDDAADAELARYALRESGLGSFSWHQVDTKEEYLRELDGFPPDLILSDYALPAFNGLLALELARKRCPNAPFIFVTGTMGEEVAIESLKKGATDYVLKTRLTRLAPAVRRAMEEAHERKERKQAEDRLRESHEQLRALSVYLQFVREEERTRIAREVHDELGQAMTSLKMDVRWLDTRLPKGAAELHEKMRKMSAHIDTTIHTIRRIATELRPGVLDDLGLVAALEWQANEFRERTGVECVVSSTAASETFDQDVNTTFFRIFQEILTNVTRHAGATYVDALLSEGGDNLTLTVKDNGRGILAKEINNTKSIGLVGMRERAALLGGEITFQGSPGRGTTVTVRIPLTHVQSAMKHRSYAISHSG